VRCSDGGGGLLAATRPKGEGKADIGREEGQHLEVLEGGSPPARQGILQVDRLPACPMVAFILRGVSAEGEHRGVMLLYWSCVVVAVG